DGIRDFRVTGVQTCALPIFGRGAVLCEKVRELHGEAAGMGGCDQFFRVGARLAGFILKPALEGIGLLGKSAALGVERAGPFGERDRKSVVEGETGEVRRGGM